MIKLLKKILEELERVSQLLVSIYVLLQDIEKEIREHETV